ncbi:VIT and VWA domain-containing protein [bacterium]|nr:VIT and VWA domain-containing protein [bacterium]MBU1985044.1 VIT and VWA domain-containing protein [bacterium]
MSAKLAAKALIVLAGLIASSAGAQIAIPVHYHDYGWECWSIRQRYVDMVVRDQVASVTVTDRIVNPCSREVEIQYAFPLPPDAAVDQFTLVVDGRELTGRMLDADEARRIYNDIVRRRRDPGLLEYAGYGFYRSSAFPLGPGKSAELVVHYTATCQKDGDVVKLWYPMSSGQFCAEPVGHYRITADIQSAGDIANVYSPSLDLDVDRKSPDRVVASYEAHRYRPLADFQLFYETSCEEVGATLLTYWPDRHQDGYYLLMVSPSPRVESSAILPKDIVIVLDRSGSMSGEKIQQAREAARFVFQNLNRDDLFNFITYNDNVESCFESMRPASRENIGRAMDRLDRMDASGGTNIYRALEVALDQFPDKRSADGRPAYVIFLTDGLPTVGITSETAILDNTRQVNRANARVFAFGVGYDVNVRLLGNLVDQNHGRSAYVKPNESIETKVSSLYTRIKNPFMTNLSVALEDFGTRDDCPAELGDLFENDQLLRTGRIYPLHEADLDRYEDPSCTIKLTVSGMLRGRKQTFEYSVPLNLEGLSSSSRFVEKLWASRRIGQLLAEIQLHGRVEEVVDELIRLSKRYGIVTPYTSFLADENRAFAAHPEVRADAVSRSKKRTASVTGPQAQMDVAATEEALSMVAPQAASITGHAMRMGAVNQNDYEKGISEEIKTIRIVGNVTLYKKGDVWLTAETADLDPVRDRGEFTVIQRYSDEYFALVNDNTAEENKVFASQKENEKLAIRLRGTVYLLE